MILFGVLVGGGGAELPENIFHMKLGMVVDLYSGLMSISLVVRGLPEGVEPQPPPHEKSFASIHSFTSADNRLVLLSECGMLSENVSSNVLLCLVEC